MIYIKKNLKKIFFSIFFLCQNGQKNFFFRFLKKFQDFFWGEHTLKMLKKHSLKWLKMA